MNSAPETEVDVSKGTEMKTEVYQDSVKMASQGLLHEGPSTQPVVTSTNVEAHAEPTGSDLARTTQHIMKYPIARSMINTVQSQNYPRLVSPYLIQMRKRPPIKPLFDAIDTFNDEVLDEVDKFIPQLQELEPETVRQSVSAPINLARENTLRLTHATEDVVQERVLTPTKKLLTDVQQRYSGILVDEKGRAIIRGQADPFVKPINDRMEKFINEHIAASDSIPSENFSNELSRSSRIIFSGILKLTPVIRSAPSRARTHAFSTYSDFKAQDGDTIIGTFRATMQTGTKLSFEIAQLVLQLLDIRALSGGSGS